MRTKIDNSKKLGKQHGGFGIQILYPGTATPESDDTGIATIGRIDHAKVNPGTLIPMHPHRDDEILTYLRSGKVKHTDSEGLTEMISNQKLMMMNAGARFYHEELVLEDGGILEGLQIFIRPAETALKPQVQFYDLPAVHSINEWRKIAGSTKEYPLQIRSNTWIQDLRLEKGQSISLPSLLAMQSTLMFYVFNGEVSVDGERLIKGESLLIEAEQPSFEALETSDVVLFITDKSASHFDGGMYSGNKNN
jgi:quercetin 2,3-dioxygenase